ncbi:suppressor of fused protein SUFU [Micromonospora pisi]|uniref:Suppressor of fused protein SUFU n=1 Tax=Micromonospora pisi TaxID=589240 RepID=A0A495JIL9_9ACTN|nr:suppressor of fused domain protein [Micromonospora pisi]RKR88172.1 suppressor of fused protein SUFU [Micromonospora pisi]
MSLEAIADHYDLYLGESEDVAPVGVLRILDFQPDEADFVTFASLGLSAAKITAVFPQEIVCSVVDGQDGAAEHLVRIAVELVLQQGRGLVNEDVIPNDGPLLAGTEIHGVLVASHPSLGDSFNVVFAEDGVTVVAELMTMIPITANEVALARREGVQTLIALLDVADVNLLDVTRDSVV